MSKNDEIVKMKREDAQALIDATVEAYNILDEAKAQAEDIADKVERAYKILEDAPAELSDIIIEDEDDEEEETPKEGDSDL